MSRSNLKLVRNSALLVAVVAVGVYVAVSVNRIVAVDPLKNFRGEEPDPSDPGVVMTNFDWKAYNGSTLIAQAHVDRADVDRDRDAIRLTQVSQGKYFEAGKVAFGFEAKNAVYLSSEESLTGTGRTRVFNDQMDLATTEFRYLPSAKSLVVPTPLLGKLQGGDLKAMSMTYLLKDKSFELKGVVWSGMVSQDNTKRTWKFGPQDGLPRPDTKTRGPVTTYTKFKATDGEIIILADGGDYNKDTDVLHVKGHVQYFGPDANMTCEEATVYRKDKKLDLIGAVDMLIKPEQGGKAAEVSIPPVVPVVPEKIRSEQPKEEPQEGPTDQEKQLRSGDNIRDYPIALTAQKVEYWYGKGKKRAVISGMPQARQEFPDGSWRMVWANSAFYDGEKETLELKSKAAEPTVRILDSLGGEMTAVAVMVSTKEGDDMMDGTGVSMDVPIKEEDLPEKIKPGSQKQGEKPPPITGPIRKSGT